MGGSGLCGRCITLNTDVVGGAVGRTALLERATTKRFSRGKKFGDCFNTHIAEVYPIRRRGLVVNVEAFLSAHQLSENQLIEVMLWRRAVWHDVRAESL